MAFPYQGVDFIGFDGLLSDDGQSETPEFQERLTYASMTGSMVPVGISDTRQTALDGLASRADRAGSAVS